MFRYVSAVVLILSLGGTTAFAAVVSDAPAPASVAFFVCLAFFAVALADGVLGRGSRDQD